MTSPTPLQPRLYVPNGKQLTVKLNDGGQPAAVVLGGVSGSPGATSVALANAWLQVFASQFMPLIANGINITGAVLRDVSAADGLVAEVGAPTANASGTRGAGRALAAASVLIKWSTARGGRSGKGRTFLPAVQSLDVNADGRTYNAAFATTVQTAITNYLTSASLQTAGLQPAVLSFTKGTAAVITGGALAGTVGVQRRRMRA